MKDIDEHETAEKPNQYACKMMKINLMCAYKALHRTTIDTCNSSMRRFLIANCLYLPKEIPGLLEALDIKGKFPNLSYEVERASFTSPEFKMFQAINSPDRNDYLVPDLDLNERTLGTYSGNKGEDTRLERTKELLKKRSESLITRAKRGEFVPLEIDFLKDMLPKH